MRITGKEIKAGDTIGNIIVMSTRTTQDYIVVLAKYEDGTGGIENYGKEETVDINRIEKERRNIMGKTLELTTADLRVGCRSGG